MTLALTLAAVTISVPFIIVGGVCVACNYGDSLISGWRRLRVSTLGGVTTLKRKLSYNCAICQDSMEAREEVRTLSCNHVFHCRESDKCKNVIDDWLREKHMVCPVCRKTPRPVLPWKAPPQASPALAPAPSPAPALAAASAGQERPESSSSGSDAASLDLEDPPRLESLPAFEEPLLQPSQ